MTTSAMDSVSVQGNVIDVETDCAQVLVTEDSLKMHTREKGLG